MNGQQQQAGAGKQKVSKPAHKFLIGFIGGFCAAIFPRLMAALALYGSSDVVLLSLGYLGIAVLFAALIGAVVMIMEWGVSKEPRATFMTALGLPALLAGALNTSNGAYVLDAKSKENLELAEAYRILSDIEVNSFDSFTPLSDAGATIKSINSVNINIIGVAYAQTGSTRQGTFNLNPSIQIQQQQYYIMLYQTPVESEAKQKAIEIQSKVPNAQAVKAGDVYLVIDPKERQKFEAVQEATRLREIDLKPVLFPKH